MNTKIFTYAVAVGEIAFALVGFAMGWASGAECTIVLTLGLSTFGIHNSNITLGRAMRGY